MRVLLDTGILIRLAIALDARHREAREAVCRLEQRGADLCCSPQNCYEFWVVATRPTEVGGGGSRPEPVMQLLNQVRSRVPLLPEPGDLVDRWLDLCVRHSVLGRQAHDARLVAFMLGHGITHLLTLNDSDFRRYSEITVLRPQDV